MSFIASGIGLAGVGISAGLSASAAGGKASVPTIATISPNDAASQAVSANLGNLAANEALVSQANQFTRDEIAKMMRQVMPGYDQITTSATGQISSMIKGDLPLSDAQQSELGSVAKAFGGGYGGSGVQGNLVARDLGLSSLQVTQQGLSSAESWMKMSNQLYGSQMLNLSSMFLTPSQVYAGTNEQNTQQFQQEWMQNQIDAQKDPVLTSLASSFGGLSSAATSGLSGSKTVNTGLSWTGLQSGYTGLSTAGGAWSPAGTILGNGMITP